MGSRSYSSALSQSVSSRDGVGVPKVSNVLFRKAIAPATPWAYACLPVTSCIRCSPSGAPTLRAGIRRSVHQNAESCHLAASDGLAPFRCDYSSTASANPHRSAQSRDRTGRTCTCYLRDVERGSIHITDLRTRLPGAHSSKIVEIEAVIDSGATMLAVPQDVVEQLDRCQEQKAYSQSCVTGNAEDGNSVNINCKMKILEEEAL
jgi:hypothetical protein